MFLKYITKVLTTHCQTYIDVYGSAANWSSGQIFSNLIQISLIVSLFFILGFQKPVASIPL